MAKEVVDALRGGESERVEFKASPKSDLREAVCALANDLGDSRTPAFLFIGINADGSCSGLQIDDALLTTLAQIRADGNLQPLPSMSVEGIDIDGCCCALITIRPTDDPPMRYRGRVWVRVGSTTLVASPQDERVLVERRRVQNIPFDHRPVPEADVSDLDLTFFQREYLPAAYAPDVLDANGRSLFEQLESLRFVREGVPTIAGLLVLGNDPQRFLPGAYAQFVAFDGRTTTDPILDQKTVTGRIDVVLRRHIELAALAVPIALRIVAGVPDIKKPRYPLSALQELIVNAILHRTYEATNAPVRVYFFRNRVEISSPGGPFGVVTIVAFGEPGITDYRNPVLADALKTLGFAQKFGFGIASARAALLANGNPLPEFRPERNFLNVVVRAPE